MPTLAEKVFVEVHEKGKITFADFMRLALYEPEQGYYQRAQPFGKDGSFYTSVQASSSFGNCLAKAFSDNIQELHLPAAFCEMGAGSGMLALDILNYLKSENPDFYHNLKYTIIEKSEYLINEQKKLLNEHVGHVHWVSFDAFNDFSGVFFSNELIDAFPVHRVIRIENKIKELYIINHEDRLTFYPDEPSTPLINKYLERIGLELAEGQIADINLDMLSWTESLSKKLDKALVFTIDYGYEAENLFSSHRRDGTVTCYYKHMQNNDFFERIGYQDITAFVDFTTLMLCGKKNGLETVTLTPQWFFLLQSGIISEIEKAENDLKKSSVKSLIMPDGGFGTNFFVLIQTKNIALADDFIYKKSKKEVLDLLAREYKI